jgi:hypothetical protein
MHNAAYIAGLTLLQQRPDKHAIGEQHGSVHHVTCFKLHNWLLAARQQTFTCSKGPLRHSLAALPALPSSASASLMQAIAPSPTVMLRCSLASVACLGSWQRQYAARQHAVEQGC